MGKCGSKAKKMDANDVPYGIKEEIKRDEIDEDIKTKVCKQEPLKEIYMPTDECTDGPIVTSSKALNFKEPYNAEKEINKLCKEETGEEATQQVDMKTMKVLTEVSNSIGMFDGKVPGSCWRAGTDLIVTAWHVVLYHIREYEDIKEIKLKDVKIKFDYTDDGACDDSNIFEVEPRVLYYNETLDTAILRLKLNNKVTFPPPFRRLDHFLIPAEDEDQMIYLIGHPCKSPQRVNLGVGLWNPIKERMQSLATFCKDEGYEYGYAGLDKTERLVVKCEFEHGASGCPGVVILGDNQVYLVTMYLRGFPDFYHSRLFKGEKKQKFPKSKLFQQGVNIGAIYDDLKKNSMYADIFEDIFIKQYPPVNMGPSGIIPSENYTDGYQDCHDRISTSTRPTSDEGTHHVTSPCEEDTNENVSTCTHPTTVERQGSQMVASDKRASSCQTMTEKHTTGSTLPKQTGTSSSHGSSTDVSSCQTMTEKPKTGSTLPKQTATSSGHGGLTDSLKQDGSLLSGLSHLLSEGSNDSTIQCDIHRCSSPTNDFESSTTSSQLLGSGHAGQSTSNMTNENMSPVTPRVEEEQLASSHSPNNPRVVGQQLSSSHYTPSNNELTNTSDITPGTSNVPENHGTVVEENQIQSTNQSSVNSGNTVVEENQIQSTNQSSVNSGNNRTEDNERNSVGDGEVGGNQEEEQEHQEVEEDQGEVIQAGEDQGEENQTGEDQQEEHQEDLDIQVDAELSQEPAIIGEISLGNNNNFNDQHLTEQIAPCDVNKTIHILAIDVGQYALNKSCNIALKGNDEVKIVNGKCIGSTARHVTDAIRDIAIHSMKPQQSF